MIAEDKLFGNFFDDIKIINGRMYNFSLDSLNRFTAANGGGDYTNIINDISPLIVTFGTEIGDVDAALNVQKGKTMTNDQVMTAFGLTMKEKDGVIASAVGGFNSATYLEFYPRGFGEYTQAKKIDMPMLTNRVKVAAAAHSAALGATLTSLLSGYKLQWDTSRDEQEQQFATVDENRTERSLARIALEKGMLTAVHTVAGLFPGDVDSCNNFFDFNLLFTHSVHRTKTFSGTVPAGGILLIINQSLTDTNKVHVQNTDANADFQIYIGHTATDEPDGRGITVKPNKGKNPKPSELGDLSDTFLLIKNLSDVNDVTFVVRISGLS